MLNIGIALIVVICIIALFIGWRLINYMKTLNEKIISLWTNGYNLKYIANKLDVDVQYVEEVISNTIYKM